MIISTTVTQQHIANGRPKRNDCCPLALSFKNHKDVKHASIFDDHAWLFMKTTNKKETHVREYWFDDSMKDFVRKFDNKETVEPTSFTFDDHLLVSNKIL